MILQRLAEHYDRIAASDNGISLPVPRQNSIRAQIAHDLNR
jgi:hypothetical protein